MQVEKYEKERAFKSSSKEYNMEKSYTDPQPLSHHLKPTSKAYYSSRVELSSRYERHNNYRYTNDSQYRY